MSGMALRVRYDSGSGGGPMRNFLAAVLSVIAVGVLLIAYGLFEPACGCVGCLSVGAGRCLPVSVSATSKI